MLKYVINITIRISEYSNILSNLYLVILRLSIDKTIQNKINDAVTGEIKRFNIELNEQRTRTIIVNKTNIKLLNLVLNK